jgi:hypothetical protein
MSYKSLYITLLSSLLFFACSKENNIDQSLVNNSIALTFHVDDLISDGLSTRATESGSISEQMITDLYVLLFRVGSEELIGKYYISNALADVTFSGGSYDFSDKKIILNMSPANAGNCHVYLVANVIINGLQPILESLPLNVPSTLTTLKHVVFRTIPQPWSPNIATPILMSGNTTHNFMLNTVLNSVHLIRAVAKLELNIKLSSGFQGTAPVTNSTLLTQYKYRFINFDVQTYAVKPESKIPNLVNSSTSAWPNTSSWASWGATLNISPNSLDVGEGYIISGGKVTELKLITYLNEKDETDAQDAVIEIELPRVDNGPLPPPEFGPELYRLSLPKKIERNNWYKYEIEI